MAEEAGNDGRVADNVYPSGCRRLIAAPACHVSPFTIDYSHYLPYCCQQELQQALT
jgi:hypothetical protein